MLKNGRPLTNEALEEPDMALITDRPQEVIGIVNRWIKKRLWKRYSYNFSGRNSNLRRIFEEDTGICLTINEFKDAMLMNGWAPSCWDVWEWEYKVSDNSPALLSNRMNIERVASTLVIISDVKRKSLEKVWEEDMPSKNRALYDFDDVFEFIEENYYPTTPAAEAAETLIKKYLHSSYRSDPETVFKIWEKDMTVSEKNGAQYRDVIKWYDKKMKCGSQFEREF